MNPLHAEPRAERADATVDDEKKPSDELNIECLHPLATLAVLHRLLQVESTNRLIRDRVVVLTSLPAAARL